MKHVPTLLTALLLAPLAAFAQAKPEVANATKAARRAWESAPAEKKALWQQQREALKHLDLSEDTKRQIVIARGSPEPGAYRIARNKAAVQWRGRPSECLLDIAELMRSPDEGTTWNLLAYVGYDPTQPKQTSHFSEEFKEDEPALRQLPSGKILLIGRPHMYQASSADEGRTWQIRRSNLTRRVAEGQKEMSGLCPILWHSPAGPRGGTTILAYHDRWGPHAKSGGVHVSFSYDAGQTWAEPFFLSPGAYPTLYEYQPGQILCGYYRSNSVLEATFFQVPPSSDVRREP